MDVNWYIESGILELYVSGLLSDTEHAEVDKMAAAHPEIQQEIDAIRASLNNYARSTGRAPSADILKNVQSQISGSSIRKSQSELTQQDKPSSSLFADFYKIAASVLLLISIGLNGYFFSELRSAKEIQVNALEQLQNLNSQFDVVTSAANMQVPLYGLDPSPQSHATVYINRQTGDVYIKIGELPAPPSGHQYQLWADRDGHMHNIGVFHHNKELQHLTIFEGDFESLNVTLEEEGGSETATVERAYLSGKVQS